MNALEIYFDKYWDSFNGDHKLLGLTPGGFTGREPLNIDYFDKKQLDWALDFAQSCGAPTKKINTNYSSYFLKNFAEIRAKRLLAFDMDNVDFISHGALIIAMRAAGFEFRRKYGTPKVYFNVSEVAIKKLLKQYPSHSVEFPI